MYPWKINSCLNLVVGILNLKGKKHYRNLAAVLEENPDISILIEGHTDNVPFSPKGQLESNWDLSTKRATAVVNILLENNKFYLKTLLQQGEVNLSQ